VRFPFEEANRARRTSARSPGPRTRRDQSFAVDEWWPKAIKVAARVRVSPWAGVHLLDACTIDAVQFLISFCTHGTRDTEEDNRPSRYPITRAVRRETVIATAMRIMSCVENRPVVAAALGALDVGAEDGRARGSGQRRMLTGLETS
jgi:hypothetical protein